MAMSTVHGVCPHDCYDACGLRVTRDGGRITAIKGDPDHPITRGFLCFKVNHYLDRVYHPDRVTQPMRRTGPKGSGEFEPVSWTDALSQVADRLNEIIVQSGGEAILPYTFAGNEGILTHVMASRFFRLVGASELDRTICTAASDAALRWIFGTDLGPDPQTLPLTRLVLLWGANPAATNIHAIPLLDQARQQGAQVWTIDPLKTATASRFDDHAALKPDSDYALAMGLAHQLIERDAIDRAFISRYVRGFDSFQKLTEPWTMDRTVAETGIAASQFSQLVDALATRRPLLIRTGWGVQRHHDGAQNIWAIAALSLILGAPKQVGGGFLSSNSGAFPLNRQSLYHVDGLSRSNRRVNMVQLGEALTDLKDPSIRALIVYQSNPAATAPNQSQVVKGLSRGDLFTVVHEQMWTDTTRYADFVFPAAMSMETLDLYVSYWHRYVQLNQPASDPLGESVSNNEFFRRLGLAMGMKYPALVESDQVLIQKALNTDHPWMTGITWESLQDQAVQKVHLDEETRPFVDTPIPTVDGYLCIEPLPLDSHRPLHPVKDPDEFHLITPSQKETIKSSFGNVVSVVKEARPELLMHPEDAARLGLSPGQWVTVYNQRGTTRFLLKLSSVPQPGTLVSYAVRWNEAAGGTNVNQLTPSSVSDFGGGATFYDARVRIRV